MESRDQPNDMSVASDLTLNLENPQILSTMSDFQDDPKGKDKTQERNQTKKVIMSNLKRWLIKKKDSTQKKN